MQLLTLRKNFKNIFFRTSNRFTALDGFRAFSILGVIIFHCFFFLQKAINGHFKDLDERLVFLNKVPAFFNWVWQGDKGVDVFFILSGFLIGYKIFNELEKNGRIDLKKFYSQRLLRILPVYIVAILIALIFIKNNAEYIWANLLFINNLVSVDKIYLPHSWSITVEMQFYFIFPLFVIFLFNKTRHKIGLLIGLFIICSLIRFALLMSETGLSAIPFHNYIFGFDENTVKRLAEVLYVNMYTRCGPIILGILSAYLYINYKQPIESRIKKHVILFNILIIISILLIYYSVSVPIHDPNADFNQQMTAAGNIFFLSVNRNIFSLGVAIIMFSSLFPYGFGRLLNAFFSLRIFYPIAELSYSIYLFHVPFIAAAAALVLGVYNVDGVDIGLLINNLKVSTVFLIAFVTLLISAGFGIVVYVFVERPFMNLYRRKKEILDEIKTNT